MLPALQLFPSSYLAKGLGCRPELIRQHVHQGTFTSPFAETPIPGRGSFDYLWREEDRPAFSLRNQSALVPASDDIAVEELQSLHVYAAPCTTANHLGRFDDVATIGLTHNGIANFYRVQATIRINFLHPARRRDDLNAEDFIPKADAERIIRDDVAEASHAAIFLDTLVLRAARRGAPAGMVRNPLQLSVYTLSEAPIATNIATMKPLRQYRPLVGIPTDETSFAEPATLDDIAAT